MTEQEREGYEQQIVSLREAIQDHIERCRTCNGTGKWRRFECSDCSGLRKALNPPPTTT